jgi:hypothetical protein
MNHTLYCGLYCEEALNIFDQTAVAFEKLNRVDEAAEVREMQDKIRKGDW